jgi:hypothetical protein
MSLVAWYKLDGNALDSSGNDNHGSPIGSLSYSNGKIAQSASFNGSDSGVAIENFPHIWQGSLTVAMWVYWNDDSRSILFGNYSTRGAINFEKNTSARLRVYWNDGQLDLNSAVGSAPIGEWAHVVFTRDVKNSFFTMFINGQNIFRHTAIGDPVVDTNHLFRIGRDSRTGTTVTNGFIDDIRIYDHALSEEEVKELSQAKVLHYDFDEFQEPTENLLYDNGTINWSIGNLTGTFTRTTIEENVRYRITSGASSSSFRVHVPITKLTNGATYTLSYNYSIVQGTTFSMSDWCDTTLFNRVDTAGYSSASGTRATYDSTFRFMDFSMSANSVVEIWNVQLEKKDHATPFVNGTRTGRVVDKSGYDNHAELALATTPQWVEGGKVGAGCYKFGGTHSLTTNKLFFDNVNQEWTVAGWVNLSNNTTRQVFNNFNAGNEIIHSSGGKALLYANSGVNDHYVYSSGIIPTNQWLHAAFVYRTSDQTCKFYINGSLDATSSNYASTDIPAGFSSTTIFGQYMQGYMDDVRIYATALSADDILSLYQSRGRLDNKGNLFLHNINQPAVVTDGLVGWWPLAGDTKDYSGFGNDGVNNGAVSTTGVTGEADTAYSFDGVDDYVSAGNGLNNLGDFTVTFWTKTNQITSGGSGYQDPAFMGTRQGSGTTQDFLISNHNGYLSYFGELAGTTTAGVTNYFLSDDTWHFVAAYRVNDVLTLKIDEEEGTQFTCGASITNNLGTEIGRAYWTGIKYTQGKIQHVRIYNRALSEGEIQLLYKEGLNLL